MNYTEAIEYLNSFGRFGSKLGLERIERLLELMGNPHQKFKSIHIGGTNGKGSVAAMVSSILYEQGFDVGLYTSPHLDDFRERIIVNKEWISRKELAKLVGEVKPLVKKVETLSHPTFFEVATAIAFRFFSQREVDYAVVEVGLGGRLDATNVIRPQVSVITNVGLEHTDVLGSSISSIAWEKGGIIKEGVPVVTAERKKEALDVFKKICRERNAELISIQDVKIENARCDLAGCRFDLKTEWRSYSLKVNLLGEHQVENAALAVLAAERLGASKRAIEDGLRRAGWPGRLEVVGRKPFVVMDCAHNPPAMRALKNSLKLFRYDRLILVIGIMKDKAIHDMLEEIAPAADYIIINKPKLERAAEPEVIRREAEKFGKSIKVVKDVKRSVRYAESIAGRSDLVLITGSIYMLSEARAKRRKKRLAQ